ncbi:hypothetical protein A7K93_11385 [Candidatus Methylacidiphilum fumarolicum]|nr:hypothetical protein A7K73_11115 [Candidatus Methylacidiphilum fumarolicum]TFE71106.1 hypothetical protein A7K93_11385 [Candidatus Methylacidiphilum fumarolicum]TFE71891.1 hypothetical protein A7K72_09955 [Candidatus Methylacidiphilum fumarolicum]
MLRKELLGSSSLLLGGLKPLHNPGQLFHWLLSTQRKIDYIRFFGTQRPLHFSQNYNKTLSRRNGFYPFIIVFKNN